MFTPVNLVLIIVGFVIGHSSMRIFAILKADFRSILPNGW